jgi:hypothetical protein
MLNQPVLGEEQLVRRRFQPHTIAFFVVALFSVLYFVDVSVRASEKYFWYDEVITLYICRLPTFHDSWQAVIHGVDYNPPLFYVILRAFRSVFGDGLIGSRIPDILGFWIFCVCLFRVVYRTSGVLPALFAMLLPMATGAYYYAYEARPHGIVLGCCGLVVLLWQLASESRAAGRSSERVYLLAFSITLLAASLIHFYALLLPFPFVCAELLYSVRFRTVRWRNWIAIIVPPFIGAVCALVLVRNYQTLVGKEFYPPSLGQLAQFYILILAPAALILFCAILLFGFDGLVNIRRRPDQFREGAMLAPETVVIGLGFLACPLVAIVLNMAANGPSVTRYFLSGLTGVCLLLGWRIGRCARPLLVGSVLCIGLAGFVTKHSISMLVRYSHGIGEDLGEPVAGIPLNTTPGKPLLTHALLTRNAGGNLPIFVFLNLDFYYLDYYAPALSPRLYFAPHADSISYRLGPLVRTWCRLHYNKEETTTEFLATNNDFLFYAPPMMGLPELQKFNEAGFAIKWLKVNDSHILAEIARR